MTFCKFNFRTARDISRDFFKDKNVAETESVDASSFQCTSGYEFYCSGNNDKILTLYLYLCRKVQTREQSAWQQFHSHLSLHSEFFNPHGDRVLPIAASNCHKIAVFAVVLSLNLVISSATVS